MEGEAAASRCFAGARMVMALDIVAFDGLNDWNGGRRSESEAPKSLAASRGGRHRRWHGVRIRVAR